MKRFFAAFAALVVIAAGCGGGSDADTAPTPSAVATPEVAGTYVPPEPPAAAPTADPTLQPEGDVKPPKDVVCAGPAYDIDGDGKADECVPGFETPTAEPTPQPTAAPTLPPEEAEEAVCDPGKVAVDTDSDGVLDGCLEDLAFEPGPTAEPTEAPAPVPTPVAVVCNPSTLHGERHEMVPVDTDGDGVADECRAPHDHPHEEVAIPDPVVEADWYADPSCRNHWRYWNGYIWTRHVAVDGVQSEDPLGPIEGYPAPVPGVPPDCDATQVGDAFYTGDISGPEDCPNDSARNIVTAPFDSDQDGVADVCAVVGTGVVLRPLTAAELGCVGPNPACRIGDNGWPVATRLVSHQELVASNGYNPNLLHDHAPDVDTDITLGYLTACLQEWSLFVPSRYDRFAYGGTPVQTCSMVWRQMAYPINNLGADVDMQCVWDAFENVYLRNGTAVSAAIHTGWAEKCGSWLDPNPVRQISAAECPIPTLPNGTTYYDLVTAIPSWTENNASGRWPDEESFRQWQCGLRQRCIDLWHQIAPQRAARINPDRGLNLDFNPCFALICVGEASGCELRFTGELFGVASTTTVRKGRCDELRLLNQLVNSEGTAEREEFGSRLPTVPPTPDTIWTVC